jgi:hypothetical protein
MERVCEQRNSAFRTLRSYQRIRHQGWTALPLKGRVVVRKPKNPPGDPEAADAKLL